jgi:hypothetical protein
MECGSVNECIHDRQSPPPLVSDYHSSDSEEDEPLDVVVVDDSVQMVTNAVILPAHEVFNSYGQSISNFEFLINYGFQLS